MASPVHSIDVMNSTLFAFIGFAALAFLTEKVSHAKEGDLACSRIGGKFLSSLPNGKLGKASSSSGDFEVALSGLHSLEIYFRLEGKGPGERIRVDVSSSSLEEIDRAKRLLAEGASISQKLEEESKSKWRSPSLMPLSILDCAGQVLRKAEEARKSEEEANKRLVASVAAVMKKVQASPPVQQAKLRESKVNGSKVVARKIRAANQLSWQQLYGVQGVSYYTSGTSAAR